MESKKDSYVRILDSKEVSEDNAPFKIMPAVQAVGEEYWTLLEVAPKDNVKLEVKERAYIGDEKRDKVDHIIKRIIYNDLSNSAKNVLVEVISGIVMDREKYFIQFMNTIGPLNVRMHSLETFPGIGKKLTSEIINERNIKPFDDFKDLKKRVKNVGDVPTHLAEKIVEELKGESTHYFFIDLKNMDRVAGERTGTERSRREEYDNRPIYRRR
ncbi:MAG: DUF655 domain-containing protein [Candidatus Altiarchaeum hamiconexum]|uniref:DUF655 domain-containing protein n=2 Tax=Candidatus Altarchaeum hamiconexum TaxID=1803513 RepID=A0A8J7YV48_9ARCH|nr:DUF655 domain-containing protein [Candidatus Altarchaeum hamiconexum]OIQ06145.1 MAG: hypothetical protein AUK59_00960 [Candidatus Altarchaeum sp. CG2_30_32_3053]PIV28899.1 MAG: DUF655 domain-containing protein [Candidatus Altarchaeum sp. CG03_land_8_20_14_0_80_32_618]PIZ29373.1 MAG: DUF655 domain-containing protein [Candidatus Altarchaeum sp. CG_4_10_14_0_8_um_filter_32_851]PJC14976.1 MAG: DUF655 domain-containing protein [Candidatus Altarchaeum sp. CG_4_9_14_0_8_um_filter_32_206]